MAFGWKKFTGNSQYPELASNSDGSAFTYGTKRNRNFRMGWLQGRRNTEAETEMLGWITRVTGTHLPSDYEQVLEVLHDGKILCRFLQGLNPNALRRPVIDKQALFCATENITNFLDSLKNFGLKMRCLSILFAVFCTVWANKVQQVHLSYSDNPTQMVVTWITMHQLDASTPPYVTYGTSKKQLTFTVPAVATAWHDDNKKTRYTYRATMTGLIPGTKYHYSVGSSDQMSDVFSYTALDPKQPLRAAVFGDFGVKGGVSLNALINATQNNEFDIIFHIGDIAYNLDDDNGTVGDDFMNEIQPIAAYVPYQVIAGNHEAPKNFTHLANRFTMPANGIAQDNQFWSVTIGNTHWVGLSTEYYMFFMPELAQKQHDWLVQDLKKNNATWTFAIMHRPMYCSNKHKSGCQEQENIITRDGEPGFPALEPVFNKYGVDMVFWGHQHSYERNWPLHKGKAYPQKDPQHYHNSATPVYMMSGSAGCHDHQDISEKIQQPYTAMMLGQYGYSLLNVVSDSLITTQFVNGEKPSEILDKFYLTKDPDHTVGKADLTNEL